MLQMQPDLTYELADRFRRERGSVYISGLDALVRLSLMQRQRDKAAGLNTAGYVTGYRGSPLGGLDMAFERARPLLEAHQVFFQPGLNEDAAATAIWGSQQLDLYQDSKVDGVFGIWYGKSPGVDRSLDPIKHGNMAGCARHGGVLAIAGDDHGCQSSSIPNQSDFDFVAAGVPVLAPSGVADIVEMGLLGLAMSRFASLWVSLKLVVETVESTTSIVLDPARPQIITPHDFEFPPGGLTIRWPDPFLAMEQRLFGPKMAAVSAFARANKIDKTTIDTVAPRLGIAASGKAYLDVRQALADLGLDDKAAAALGIRLRKIGMVWPLEREGALGFARGLSEILVIEEKRSLIESQLASALFNLDAQHRPRIVGKRDDQGALIPEHGEINSTLVANAIVRRLAALGAATPELLERARRLTIIEPPPTALARTPFFCSGCPHNTSTRIPEGSRAQGGIGCHGMAIFMPDRKTGPLSHMGGEGLHWVGQAPFSRTEHVFQNLGDGTYSHSGILAIRAAKAANVNITYKILFNGAVAMTGGQPVEGALTIAQITHQMKAEGAARIFVVTAEPESLARQGALASGVEVRERDELDAVQRELRDTPGLTILIYDQVCAAENRRRRKRKIAPDPQQRVFINDAVCEGCGDCSAKSNCISVQPLETELGRKRVIDQSSCNKDFSCLKGFCPSFVTVHGGKPRTKALNEAPPALPAAPRTSFEGDYNILITGIGGTGVITIGQIIGMAAHLDGLGCSVLDNTGLAQKNGAVTSHVRLSLSPGAQEAVRIPAAAADLVIACDSVTAAGAAAVRTMNRERTRLIGNADIAPTSAFVGDGNAGLADATLERSLRAASRTADFLHATRIATALLGDSIAVNMFMLGYAFQKEFVPLSEEALERAIELNGVAIDANRRAFAWGRAAARDLAGVEALIVGGKDTPAAPMALEDLIEARARMLIDYQNEAYADEYRAFMAQAREAEARLGGQRQDFSQAVAKALFKLMAYKDEYEVGRLYSNGAFKDKLRAQFEGEYKLSVHLAPPLIAPIDKASGEPRKIKFGAWIFPLFNVLARLRRLRGTRFDIFGFTSERRAERADIAAYRAAMRQVFSSLDVLNYDTAVALAGLPMELRGFGHVKAANRKRIAAKQAELFDKFGAAAAIAAE